MRLYCRFGANSAYYNKVLILAIVYVVRRKKTPTNDKNFGFEHEYDHEDDGKCLNKYYKHDEVIAAHVSYTEILLEKIDFVSWLNVRFKALNPIRVFNNESTSLSQHQLIEAKNSRIREVRVWQALSEIAIYLLFILILFYITYTNIGTSAYDYQNALKNMFALSEVSMNLFLFAFQFDYSL